MFLRGGWKVTAAVGSSLSFPEAVSTASPQHQGWCVSAEGPTANSHPQMLTPHTHSSPESSVGSIVAGAEPVTRQQPVLETFSQFIFLNESFLTLGVALFLMITYLACSASFPVLSLVRWETPLLRHWWWWWVAFCVVLILIVLNTFLPRNPKDMSGWRFSAVLSTTALDLLLTLGREFIWEPAECCFSSSRYECLVSEFLESHN